jgi:hypothetical protein
VLGSPLGASAAAAAANGDPQLLVTTTSLPAIETGQPLAIQLAASGGTPPYQWVPGSLPAGVTITSGGLLGGEATATGSEPVRVSVVDADNQRVSATLQLQVASGPSIATSALPGGEVGKGYSFQLAEVNGVAPFTWSVPKGGLPGGLVLSSSGLLSGRPGVAGTATIELAVTDGTGSSAEAALAITVLAPPPPPEGYVSVDAAGQAVSVGLVVRSSPAHLAGKTVGVAVEPSGAGYWTVTSVGKVHAVGAARGLGSVARRDLEGMVVGIAAPIGGTGYWIVSSTGHVYGFGSARSLGSVPQTGPHALRGRVVGIAATTLGRGYWIVSSTGQVYGFGSARPLPASAGAATGTVVGIASAPSVAGAGYWVLTRAGAIFAYGAAREIATSPPQPVGGPPGPVPSAGLAGAR